MENYQGIKNLALLPNKFHKLIWIKRNDYLIVNAEETSEQPNHSTMKDEALSSKLGVKYMIEQILSKDQIKHIRANNLWPVFIDDEAPKNDEDKTDMRICDDNMPGYQEPEDIDEDDADLAVNEAT